MRQYEIVYILDPSLGREAVDAKIGAFHEVLGGEVQVLDHWGVRQLAYPIRKTKTAYYVIAQVAADPVALPEFERLVKLDEEALRYLVVVNEGLPTSGDSILAARPQDAASEAGPDGAPGASGGQGGGPGTGSDTPAASGDRAESSDDSPAGGAEGEGEKGEGTAAKADDGSAARPDDGTPYVSPTAPPVFSGPRGRRRRHDGPPVVLLNYKDVVTLARFLTEEGKILPKRTTKVTARFQRQLGTAVKRARHLALLPYVRDHEA